MSSGRLEMVVKGRRQTALSTVPRLIGPALLDRGFIMEEHQMTSFELPDHWIPNYLVTFMRVPQPAKRYLLDAGRERETVIGNWSGDVVPPEEVRKFRFEGEARTVILSIDPEVLQSMISGSRHANAFELIRRWHGKDPILIDLLSKLRSEIQSGFPTGALPSEHLCRMLTEQLIQRYPIGKVRLDQYKGGLPGPKLKQVVEYIEDHLDFRLTTGEIARIAGLSKYHLGKAFSTSTGMPLHSFVLARRMRKAREFLASSELPLAQIADAVGFSSQSHFTTVFLERTGLTPGRFRSVRRPLLVAFDRSSAAD
jgi:AraC family transcriptional regulator